jgi:hypothetical protein
MRILEFYKHSSLLHQIVNEYIKNIVSLSPVRQSIDAFVTFFNDVNDV